MKTIENNIKKIVKQKKPAIKDKTNTLKEGKKRNNNPNNQVKTNSDKKSSKKKAESVKVIPLGGLNEIGKNLTILEYKDQIILIDCGLSFPEDEMLGIDIVIPDFTYLINNQEKIKGMFITHGHEDHIGGIPYLLKKINLPIYGTKLTLGLVENKLKEHGIVAELNTIKPGDKVKLGSFEVEAIRTTHSIADAICLAINTPAGLIFHTGDFKVDYTPIDGEPIDFNKLAELGKRGVTLMLADSTNALRPGFTASERVVGQALDNIVRDSNNRIIIATFSSNVHRVQKIVDIANQYGRKVAVSGRSMENVVALSQELGYLNVPAGTMVDIKSIKNIPDNELVIITTGSQGEPMSALSRMAANDHKTVKLKKGDTVIFSSSPVPGNEKTVTNVVNRLFEKGINVIYSDIADIHVSGHACQEELKLMHSIIKPKFFIPVHGEIRHLMTHARLAESLGMESKNIFILGNGDQLSVNTRSAQLRRNVTPAEAVLVDGLGVGDVGNIVLRDRKLLSESGLIVVMAAINRSTGEIISGPELVSRGFVYVRENEDLMKDAQEIASNALEAVLQNNSRDWNSIKSAVRDELRTYIYDRTKRNPMILPIFLDI